MNRKKIIHITLLITGLCLVIALGVTRRLYNKNQKDKDSGITSYTEDSLMKEDGESVEDSDTENNDIFSNPELYEEYMQNEYEQYEKNGSVYNLDSVVDRNGYEYKLISCEEYQSFEDIEKLDWYINDSKKDSELFEADINDKTSLRSLYKDYNTYIVITYQVTNKSEVRSGYRFTDVRLLVRDKEGLKFTEDDVYVNGENGTYAFFTGGDFEMNMDNYPHDINVIYLDGNETVEIKKVFKIYACPLGGGDESEYFNVDRYKDKICYYMSIDGIMTYEIEEDLKKDTKHCFIRAE